jgi:tRNA (Thr-GGU) A37 N-methylase
VFDKNDGSRGKGWTFKSKIKAPKLEGKKTGIFASRSPHRFNPIGLSVVRLESVETNVQIGMQKHVVLNISGLDLVHNTTILDVKPYHPADKIQNSKSPDWLAIHNQENFLNVEFTKEAINSIQNAIDSKSLKFYSDFNSIQQAIIECLQIDPRTTHSKSKSHELYGIAIDRLDISFRHVFSTNSILVFHIALIQAGQIRPRMRSQSWLKTHSHKNS